MSAPRLRPLRRPRLWLSLGVLLLALTMLASLAPLPRLDLPLPGFHIDKLEHGLGYGVLAVYATMLFAPGRALAFAGLGLVGYGLLIEGLQTLVPWRYGDLHDAAANTLGVALGLLFAATPLARTLQWLDGQRAQPRPG